MQGVIKAYDPTTGDGLVMCDTDLQDYELAGNALEGSLFRMLREPESCASLRLPRRPRQAAVSPVVLDLA